MARAARAGATPTHVHKVPECRSRSSHGQELDLDGIVQASVSASDRRQAYARKRLQKVSDKDMKEMVPGSETMHGTIAMLKEGGAWKVEQKSWKN